MKLLQSRDLVCVCGGGGTTVISVPPVFYMSVAFGLFSIIPLDPLQLGMLYKFLPSCCNMTDLTADCKQNTGGGKLLIWDFSFWLEIQDGASNTHLAKYVNSMLDYGQKSCLFFFG